MSASKSPDPTFLTLKRRISRWGVWRVAAQFEKKHIRLQEAERVLTLLEAKEFSKRGFDLKRARVLHLGTTT
jgi:hypothetical protein